LPPDGLAAATTDCDRIRFWWQDHPDANVALVTGVVCDVIDTDPDTGRRAFKALTRRSSGLGPVARTGTGRWLFFTAPSGRPGAVLADGDDATTRPGPLVRWRGLDGSVLAPPSRTLLGNSARWTHPFATELPDPYELAQVLTDAVTATDDQETGRLARLMAPVRRVRSRAALG